MGMRPWCSRHTIVSVSEKVMLTVELENDILLIINELENKGFQNKNVLENDFRFAPHP